MITGPFRLSLASRFYLAPDKGDGEGGDNENDNDENDDVDDDANDDENDDDANDDVDHAAETEKWKKLARKHERRAKANAQAAKELAELKAKNLPPDERAVKEAEDRGRAAAKVEHAQDLAAARIEAALTGVVDDPAAFVEDLNLAKYVTDDGDVDVEAIGELKAKWAGLTGSKGDDDDENEDGKRGGKPKPDLKQGKRGKGGGGKPQQLSREQIQSMTPEQIEAARLAGQLDDLLGIKT